MDKCNFNGFSYKPDGIHELDPCIYEEIETIENCTVHILKCKKCGHIEIMWNRGNEEDEMS